MLTASLTGRNNHSLSTSLFQPMAESEAKIKYRPLMNSVVQISFPHAFTLAA